jgi:hypothetical protein
MNLNKWKAEGIWEIYVPYPQLSYKPKPTLKNWFVGAAGIAQVIKHLARKLKALKSTHRIIKKQNKNKKLFL